MKRKKRKIYLYLLIILGITVGFALLSTTLYINGTAGIKANVWDIHWDQDSIKVTENSVAAETPTVTENGQKLSYEVTLELPGDFYEFTIDAVNAGTIDGMISIDGLNPTITYADGSPTTLSNDIHYSVTYADGSAVEQYHKLAKRVDANTPTREKFKIRIEFDKEATSPIGEDKTYKILDDVPYTQGDERAKDRDTLNSKTVYINHLGKSETLDPTWTYYFKINIAEVRAEHDMYTIFGENNGEILNFYDLGGMLFDTSSDCDHLLNIFDDEHLYCDVKIPTGSKYTMIDANNSEACMLMPNGYKFCYEYGNYDCTYDDNTNDCNNNAIYINQKKNEILNNNGIYVIKKLFNFEDINTEYQGIIDTNTETGFLNATEKENATHVIYVLKNIDNITKKTYEFIMLGDSSSQYRCVFTGESDYSFLTYASSGGITDYETHTYCYNN